MALDPTKKFKPRKVSEIECTAYHEAGHAFAYWKYDIPIKNITIIPDNNASGKISVDLRSKVSEKQLYEESEFYKIFYIITCAFAGVISEALYSGLYNQKGFYGDFEKLVDIVIEFFIEDEERSAFLDWIWLRTFNILSFRTNWMIIEAIANELIKRKKITDAEILDIICESTRRNTKVPIEKLKHPPGLIKIPRYQ